MRATGGKPAIRGRVTRVLLDREEQFRHCLIKATPEEMGSVYYRERLADADAGTEAQRGLDRRCVHQA